MEKDKHGYVAKIRQPQTVCGVRLVPEGGELSPAEYEAMKKDAYGASLLENGMISVERIFETTGNSEATAARIAKGKPSMKRDMGGNPPPGDDAAAEKNSAPAAED